MKSFALHCASTFAIGAVVVFFLLLPLLASAQQYEPFYRPMVVIPGVTDITAQNGGVVLSQYVNALYALAIVIAGMIAVVKLVLAGAKYMMSDSFTTKGQAIEDIKGALLGILIILTAFLILATINPRLTGIDFIPENQVAVDPSAGLTDLFNLGQPACIGDGSCRLELCPRFWDGACQRWCTAQNGQYIDRAVGWGAFADGAGTDRCIITDSLIPQGEPMEDYPGWYYCPEVTYNQGSVWALTSREACDTWCQAAGGDPYFNLWIGGGFAGRYANQCNLGSSVEAPAAADTRQTTLLPCSSITTIGGSTFDCTAAELSCTNLPNSDAAEIDFSRGQVVCLHD